MKHQLLIAGLALALLLSGCSYSVPPVEEESEESQVSEETPFEDSGSNIIGEISHGSTGVEWSEDGEIIPLEYQGGEFTLNYRFAASGRAESIGFLLFLDGVPQPYQTSETDEPSYCHTFSMENEVEQDFTFRFTPITGKPGDTLELTILSIYYPTFQPDMVESSSYGFYQGILQYKVPIKFLSDAPDVVFPETLTSHAAQALTLRDEKFTKYFLETELPANGVPDPEAIENNAYYTIAYDGKLELNNLDLTNKDTVTIRYKLVGPEGVGYSTTFYLDHKPISFEGQTSFETTLSKGGVWVAELTLDISKLADLNTFYVISTPIDGDDLSVKTNSILFYKEK